MSTKWTVVAGTGGKRAPTAAVKEANSKKIGGLQESTGTFAQFSRQVEEEDESKPPPPKDASSSTKTRQKVSPTNNTEAPVKKRTITKKPKIQQKYDYDEFVRELDPKTLQNLTKEAHQKYPNHSQNLLLLKEVTQQLQQLFGDVEVEREFAFTNRTPGYPLNALSDPCKKPLISLIRSCPPLVQESIFRYCLDTLLTEVRTVLPTYGSRIILQLLINCKPSTCTECTQKIKLLLQSSLSKVPEALSLLWAGLPHPQLYLVSALDAWPELCLPLLYSTPNVPRQVLNYAVDYTCVLLRVLDERGGTDLAFKLPPTTLCALLASPLLSTRKMQTNVQEMLHQLETTLIGSSSDREVNRYFTAVFKRLSEDKQSEVAISFAMCCLSHSVFSVRSWCTLFPSLPFSSQVLLKELAGQEQLSTDLPLHEISLTLYQIVARGSPEEKTLAQGLLTRHNALFRASQKKQREIGELKTLDTAGGWCSGCGFLIILLSIVYLVLLSLLLLQLARTGPGKMVEVMQQYVPVRGEWLDRCTDVMWRALSLCVQLWDNMTNKLLELF